MFILVNVASAIDSSNWTTADVGGETFKIPPQYANNPYKSDDNIYWLNEDNIYAFCVRLINPNLMSLYGYDIEHSYYYKNVNVAGHDAVHFKSHDRFNKMDYSTLWFCAGNQFYYIQWEGENITPEIKEIVKSSSKSNYTQKEFKEILNDEYQNYKIVNSIESQRYDYPTQSKGFYSYGPGGWSFGRFY